MNMTRLHDNLILLTDSYKLSHYKQYPPGTQTVFSYFESRVGAKYPYTVFFGLQYFIRRYLQGQVATQEKLEQAESVARIHMGGGAGTFNREGWQYIIDKYNGFLPIRIRAVPEGVRVPTGNVMLTIENTDPKCFWLTNFLETLLVELWYPCTVATHSNYCREMILKALEETGNPALVDFKLHDFGFRGASSVESAGIGGLAHLVNFKGTDTLPAIGCGMEYYDAGMAGFSIPASEHSTITSWGEAHEVDAYRNMLVQYPDGLVACVSDSFDIGRACTELWGKELKEEVLNRNGTLVVRPDSGEVVYSVLDVLHRLGEAFGTYVNSKGFKVLNDKVRVIQGDGCTPETIKAIIDAMIVARWSLDNVAFGMGGGLLQKVDRDTQRFAFKCSALQQCGNWHDVFKRPKSDPTKNSKGGRITLVKDKTTNEMRTIRIEDFSAHGCTDLMRTVFENGEFTHLDVFDNIRRRATTK